MNYFKAILEYESLNALKSLEKTYKKPLEKLANYVLENTNPIAEKTIYSSSKFTI